MIPWLLQNLSSLFLKESLARAEITGTSAMKQEMQNLAITIGSVKGEMKDERQDYHTGPPPNKG